MIRPLVIASLVGLVATGIVPCQAQEAPAPRGSAAKPAPAVVNLNTATLEQFATLPGIGQRTAERILEYRQKNGPFKKVEDLMNVKGIGEKSFLRIKALVTIGPARADQPGPQGKTSSMASSPLLPHAAHARA